MSVSQVTAGRPRDPRIEEAVLEATRRLLAEQGYDAVSVESIAREAGVSRPAIYRRWPTKAHVVFDAAFPVPDDAAVLPRTGDVETDLRRMVRGAFLLWSQPVQAAASAGIVAEWRTHPELRERMQSRLDDAARAEFRDLVRDGIGQGRLRAGVDADALFDLIAAYTFYAVQVRAHTDVAVVEDDLLGVVLDGVRAGRETPTGGSEPSPKENQ
jgi:AcrR family transcriptional regulator